MYRLKRMNDTKYLSIKWSGNIKINEKREKVRNFESVYVLKGRNLVRIYINCKLI